MCVGGELALHPQPGGLPKWIDGIANAGCIATHGLVVAIAAWERQTLRIGRHRPHLVETDVWLLTPEQRPHRLSANGAMFVRVNSKCARHSDETASRPPLNPWCRSVVSVLELPASRPETSYCFPNGHVARFMWETQ